MSLALGCLLDVKAEAHCGTAPIKAPSLTDSVQAWVLRYLSSSSALARPRLLVEECIWAEKQELWGETNKMSRTLNCLLRLEGEAHCGAAPIFVCVGHPAPRRHFCRTASMPSRCSVPLPTCQFSSSHSQLLRGLQLSHHVASSQPPAPQLLRVLKLYYKVAANRALACISRTRHARSPQRVAREFHTSHSRLHFAHSTRTISAEGCAAISRIALSPAFRALDARDLRRGLRGHPARGALACISRTRHARSPQRVAPGAHGALPAFRALDTRSPQRVARMGRLALSPAFRATFG